MKKILIVDDDYVQIKLLNKHLTEKGYKIIFSSEAAEGLQMAMDKSPDMIILDVMMPIINGYNFCRLLKSEEKYKHIPIVFLTSRDNEDDIQIGREMGAEAYLIKPVNMEELLEKIKDLMPV